MNSTVVAYNSPTKPVPAGTLQPGTLVTIDVNGHVGLITTSLRPGVNLIDLSDQSTWSEIAMDMGPLVVPFHRGATVTLEAV